MTAYVHIGTMKTGTTTIQQFLVDNSAELLKQGFLYPKSILYQNKHSPLGVFAYSEYKYEAYTIAHRLNDMFSIREHNKKQMQLLKDELNCHKDKSIIFSSEGIQVYLTKIEEIEYFKTILNSLGIKQVYILIYIRNPIDAFSSLYNQRLRYPLHDLKHSKNSLANKECNFICSHARTIKMWSSVFGKSNIVVKLFNRSDFYHHDLLQDFAKSINLEWQESFKIPLNKNESLDLIGMELLSRINKALPLIQGTTINKIRGDIVSYLCKFFLSDVKELSFKPSKNLYYYYEKYFEESNEWVRKEFFPFKKSLFFKKDLDHYKENYELKELKSEHWDKIADFVVDIVKTKNKTIQEGLIQIQNLN
ncbi:TPA: hypothetical protein SG421_001528, partial [Campylobacter coli]|nr:hypothetical protein [Campylobacter coli]